MWALFAEKTFWAAFSNHTGKLECAQAFSVLVSSEPISSVSFFNERVRQGSHSAHMRKLRGLYVDYANGALRLPSEITEHETWHLIDSARTMLDRSRASWAARVRQAEWWSALPRIGPVIWLLFLGWAVETYPDEVITMLRDAGPDGALWRRTR